MVNPAPDVMRTVPTEVPERISQLMDDRKKLERELAEAKRQLAMGGGGQGGAAEEAVDIGGVKVMARALEGIDPKDLRTLVDQAKQKLGWVPETSFKELVYEMLESDFAANGISLPDTAKAVLERKDKFCR